MNQEIYEEFLFSECGFDNCPGIMMEYGEAVLCSEQITGIIKDFEEGAGG